MNPGCITAALYINLVSILSYLNRNRNETYLETKIILTIMWYKMHGWLGGIKATSWLCSHIQHVSGSLYLNEFIAEAFLRNLSSLNEHCIVFVF